MCSWKHFNSYTFKFRYTGAVTIDLEMAAIEDVVLAEWDDQPSSRSTHSVLYPKWYRQLIALLSSLEEAVIRNFEKTVPKSKVREVTMTYLCHLEEEKTIVLDMKTGDMLTMLSPDWHGQISADFGSWLTQQLDQI